MYKIDFPKRVTKQLDKIPDKDYPPISRAIQNLKGNPRPTGCKKLHESLYRIRVGDYRIIYWIDDKTKTIVITNFSLLHPCPVTFAPVFAYGSYCPSPFHQGPFL